jgi:hypothetical protein
LPFSYSPSAPWSSRRHGLPWPNAAGADAPEHTVALVKSPSLAAWHGGYEHYVTGFEFAGRVKSFGYIIPLPAVRCHQGYANASLQSLAFELFSMWKVEKSSVGGRLDGDQEA